MFQSRGRGGRIGPIGSPRCYAQIRSIAYICPGQTKHLSVLDLKLKEISLANAHNAVGSIQHQLAEAPTWRPMTRQACWSVSLWPVLICRLLHFRRSDRLVVSKLPPLRSVVFSSCRKYIRSVQLKTLSYSMPSLLATSRNILLSIVYSGFRPCRIDFTYLMYLANSECNFEHNTSSLKAFFFSITSRSFSLLLRAFSPCQGRVPRMKYIII